jgi:hypothetical protein
MGAVEQGFAAFSFSPCRECLIFPQPGACRKYDHVAVATSTSKAKFWKNNALITGIGFANP